MAGPSGDHETGVGRRSPQDAVVQFVKERWLPIVLIILVIVFVAQNRERASIDIFWVHVNSSLWFALAVTAIVGFVIGMTVARRREKRRRPSTREDL
jgi:uncharacterized integral membrane protein